MELAWPENIIFIRHFKHPSHEDLMDNDTLSKLTSLEIPLSEEGKREATDTAKYLKRRFEPIDYFFVSRFLRSRQSLELMYPDITPIIDSRLDEWTPITKDWAPNQMQEVADVLNGPHWYDHEFENGCSMRETEAQIHSFINTLRVNYSGKRVCLIGHGIWGILFWRTMEGKTLEQAKARIVAKKLAGNGSITLWRNFSSRANPLLVLDGHRPDKS